MQVDTLAAHTVLWGSSLWRDIMQRRTRIGMAACMAAAAVCWVGCAAIDQTINSERMTRPLLDFATVNAGATIKSAGSSGERTAESLINGVKDSAKWSEGEGWEYTWTLGGEQQRNRRNEERGIAGIMARGGPWVVITFDEPKRINQIVIHEANAHDAPAVGIENAFLQVRDLRSERHPWKTVATVQSGWALIPGRQQFKMKPVSKFLFNTVKTDQVRIIINTMLEKKRTTIERQQANRQPDDRRPDRRADTRRVDKAATMTLRLMEIEVKGSEADLSNGASNVGTASGGSEKKSAMKEPM